MRGYVYFLSNDSMPGLYKIGSTERNVETRMQELYNTPGIPTEFKCELKLYVPDCKKGEALMQKALSKYRVNPNREFYKVDMDIITKNLDVLYHDLDTEVNLYSESLCIVGREYKKKNYKDLLDANYTEIRKHNNDYTWFSNIYMKNGRYYRAEVYYEVCTQEQFDQWLKRKNTKKKIRKLTKIDKKLYRKKLSMSK